MPECPNQKDPELNDSYRKLNIYIFVNFKRTKKVKGRLGLFRDYRFINHNCKIRS